MCFVYFIFIFLTYFSYFNNDSKKPGFFFSTILKGKMVSHDPREIPSHNHSAIKNIRVSLLWFTIKHCPAPAEQLNILFILLIYFFTVSSLSLNDND